MQEVYFFTRHTPFWAIPLILLGAEFGYLFWLKKRKLSALLCLSLALLGVLATVFYIWAGGPERAVKVIKKIHIEHKN